MTSHSQVGEQAAGTAPASATRVCARCGAVASGAAATWTCSVEHGVRRYFCGTCARENLRAIEGRLDSDSW
ncbi:hypothetical protein ACIQU5_01155 [Streptomyces sp. NPDC090306]|uniref:hypothetical protein n=1 Tax=unclassified Streptomyces TaxID=2593676 RepID=UPI0036F01BDF